VAVTGSVSALLELGAGFHPELSGRENVFLNAAILGVPRKHIVKRFDDIVEFSGLEQFIDTPVKNYSSGMFVRLGFAVAINVDPAVLIIDEVLAVGDAEFQAKCGDKIAEFRERGKTIVLVTHAMGDVVRICQRAAWLDHGRIREIGAPNEIADAYLATTHVGRSVHVQDGLRWGSGEVQIDTVELLDGGLQPAEFARTGDPLAFRVHLSSRTPVIGPEVVVSLHDIDGRTLTEVSTRTRDVHIDQVDGARTLTLEIDQFPLSEGTYELSAAVRDETGQREFDVRSRMLRFDVLKGKIADGGVLTLPARWVL
jgi:ABC-2 type transport system ATP-binding protein